MKLHMSVFTAAFSLAMPQAVLAEAPTIQTVGPVIHLADNLDEEAKLGWCIDTVGRGDSDKLHSHSCKPTGGDVLFSYEPASGMIKSVTYAGKCMAYNAPDSATNPFGLITCDASDPAQQFAYDGTRMEVHLASDAGQCLTVAPEIDDAGPFQSRNLRVAACDSLAPAFKQWVIRD